MKLMQVNEGQKSINFKLQVENPSLWYPIGYGNQKMYYETVSIYSGETLIDEQEISFGIRDLQLDQNKEKDGESFFFSVNGQPIFCKGANYVPQDMFLPRVTEEKTRELLVKAKNANMNMIRVWGGGIYEEDCFYDLCDSLGLLIWQDFMFANSMYPTSLDFNDNVREEVIENVERLRNHPSIALWCGNNEIEVAWENWGWQDQYNIHGEDSVALWNNYDRIFRQMIPEILRKYDPERNYISSSPISLNFSTINPRLSHLLCNKK